MGKVNEEAAEALRTTSGSGLLRAYAGLTHQMHGARGQASEEEARAKRDEVAAEILSRMGDSVLARLPIGAKVKVVDCLFGHEFKIGEVVTLERYHSSSNDGQFVGEDGKSWWLREEEIEVLS